MKNIKLLKDIFTSDHHYWIVAKQNHVRQYMESKRTEDSILLISIPNSIERNIEYKDIKLSEAETLNDKYIDTNIFLSDNYPPFQTGQRMSDFYDGFAITYNKEIDFNKLIIEMLNLKSTSLYDYKKLLKPTT